MGNFLKLKILNIEPKKVGYGVFETDPFFTWYAHLFYYDRRKCLIFVNALTRYTVTIPGLKVDEIRQPNKLLCESLKIQLACEGVPEGIIRKFLEHLYMPELTKSKNKSIIGTAVESQRHIEFYLEGGRIINEVEMGMKLSRIPTPVMKPDCFPHTVFKNELLSRYGQTGKFPMEISNHIK